MRSRRSRRLAALVAAAAVAAALAAGFFPQEPLRRLAEAQLRSVFGDGSRLARLRVVPARLLVEVEGLVLDNPALRSEAERGRIAFAPYN